MKIGVDVGGTNTDAVVLGENGVLGWRKTPTTADVYSGIVAAITQAIADAKVDRANVDCVMIGTTQFTNAVIQRRSLLPVGIIRLALPATSAIPPLTDWPADLIAQVGQHAHLVAGGYEFDGREIAPLDEMAVAEAARTFARSGIRTAAVTSVFSPMNGDMEKRAAEILRNEAPDIAVSLSCELGQFGLLPRENSTIINAALSELSGHVVQAFRQALSEAWPGCPPIRQPERRHFDACRRCTALPCSDLCLGADELDARCSLSGRHPGCDGCRYRRHDL